MFVYVRARACVHSPPQYVSRVLNSSEASQQFPFMD